MPSIEFEGKTIEVDDDGYVINLDDWTEGLAQFLADYYQKYQIAPMIKILVKEIGKAMGKEKGNTKYLYQLYPGGPAKQACRYAGLPKPTGCV
jgi:tRNA 2-thiouridine synthesizing protein E